MRRRLETCSHNWHDDGLQNRHISVSNNAHYRVLGGASNNILVVVHIVEKLIHERLCAVLKVLHGGEKAVSCVNFFIRAKPKLEIVRPIDARFIPCIQVDEKGANTFGSFLVMQVYLRNKFAMPWREKLLLGKSRYLSPGASRRAK